METKVFNYRSTLQWMPSAEIEIPSLCPRCSVSNNPIFYIEGHRVFKDGDVAFISLECSYCSRWSFIVIQKGENQHWNLLSVSPNSLKREFDSAITKCSPRFVESYNAAYNAEQNGYLDLAGSGYRACAEILIKDWALKYSGESKEQISKYKLNDAISHFFNGNIAAFNASDVVRYFGNDFTHWDRPEDFDARRTLDEVKIYLDILIQNILLQLKIANPPVGRGHSVSKSN
ncbi:DUF4145 domain-containing protein [Pediococcus acidilactici]|uniref:DUF4145 domain-containing protein n=1 Tax=Pediococcus acidilactici TaxID=1254 RepID=UPI0011087AFB|nr:DUF4145 domain-containing protein [Pediococcus acidilactici]KAF0342531.1 DUF4145 domain-containing protein [Pediococcus acidilactici]KAF0368635.1 DUF4145 domain-containing protein [Pediococcus acidilactici]MDD9324214.1 DUF4145 domain-containing protein [Pediococcus acidilactici]NBI15665.1 DUF4145 domain-containing protein [Pediococcus acidilactici]NFA46154.1 DUF4145 domain-containing protein [Pediococcus acidilactici]